MHRYYQSHPQKTVHKAAYTCVNLQKYRQYKTQMT